MLIGTQELLTQKGPDYIDAVVQSQRQKGIRDTGYSAENTRFTLSQQGYVLTFQIIGPAYWRQQQYGRGPNRSRKPSRQFIETMKAWAVRKGLSEELGKASAFKIAKYGIAVPNPHNPGGVISDALNPNSIVSDLKSELTPLLKQSIKSILFAP